MEDNSMRTMPSTFSVLKTVGSITQIIFIKLERQETRVYSGASQMTAWSRREGDVGLNAPERGY